MARLNEPPAPVDSFENLRRKFLRQNRDIARVNSNQSLRIRGLENECARLLSENLQLRGQVLRLEKELENDRSRYVADHALQIKQKMETQLVELGALLASFGVEPSAKRLSHTTSRYADKPVTLNLPSEVRSPQRKCPALSPSEAESLAIQEGRLPPIFEDDSYPGHALTHSQSLTLRSGSADVATSPRYVPSISLLHSQEAANVTQPSKQSTSTIAQEVRNTSKDETSAIPKEPINEHELNGAAAATSSQSAPSSSSAQSKSEPVTKTLALRILDGKSKLANPSTIQETSITPCADPVKRSTAPPSSFVSKASGKRKFAVNDENAVIQGMKVATETAKALETQAKAKLGESIPSRELKTPRSIRSLANCQKEIIGNRVEPRTIGGDRKPLAAKSTNEHLSSPRKQNAGEGKIKSSGYGDKAAQSEGRMRSRARTSLAVEITELPLPVTLDVVVDDDTVSTKCVTSGLPTRDQKESIKGATGNDVPNYTDSLYPQTPLTEKLLLSPPESRDTPPPADISSQGETSRPNRRSRASVSYAEPNLRDKMRRPTKELLDAVTGEGKYIQRQNLQTQPDEQTEVAPLASKPDLVSSIGGASQHKAQPVVRAQQATEEQPCYPANNQGLCKSTASSVRVMEAEDEKPESCSAKSKCATKNTRSSSKTNRRASMTKTREEEISAADRHTRPSAARKRASMVTLKHGSIFDDVEDNSADISHESLAGGESVGLHNEGGTLSTRERISRRRSMMA